MEVIVDIYYFSVQPSRGTVHRNGKLAKIQGLSLAEAHVAMSHCEPLFASGTNIDLGDVRMV